ncbi:MAG: general stress protein [Candidatus Buchananbacteria bacterium]
MTTKRGLASADMATRERVASEGGKASQRSGRAHRLTLEERRKGGQASHGGGRRPEM